MALIQCPECGREVSDQAPAYIHCGYPLTQAKEERYALILVSLTNNYGDTIREVQDQLLIDSYIDAKALVDSAPVALKRDMGYEECLSLAERFRQDNYVKIVRDRGEDAANLLVSQETAFVPAPSEERHGLGFGGTVAAVILGVVAAILLLSIF